MASYTTVALGEERAKIGVQAKELAESIDANTTAERAAEIETQVERMLADYDKYDAKIKTAEKLESITRDLNNVDPRRPTEDRSVAGFREVSEMSHEDAFRAAIRSGGHVSSDTARVLSATEGRALRVINGSETRAQGEATGAAGGYLVPIDLASQIIIALKASGPMMDPDVCQVVHTDTGAVLNWPTMDDTANQGYRVSENALVSNTTTSLGQIPMQAWKYSTGIVQYSSELAQDSAFNLQSFLSDAMVVRAGRVGNADLTNGAGAASLAPNGIITAIGNSIVQSANTAVITFDDILNLEHSVDPDYRSNAGTRFQFHDTTFKALRLLKDNYGRYIWEPATQLGAEATLFGYKYSINQAFPVYGTSGNKIVVFGDHKRYLVRIVKDFALRLLQERYADYDQLALVGFMRMDGNLLDQSGRALNSLSLR